MTTAKEPAQNPEGSTAQPDAGPLIIGRIKTLLEAATRSYAESYARLASPIAGANELGWRADQMMIDSLLAHRYQRMLADLDHRSLAAVIEKHAAAIDEALIERTYVDRSTNAGHRMLGEAHGEALGIARREVGSLQSWLKRSVEG